MSTSRPTVIDESPNSVFVQEMKAAFTKRLTASGARDKRQVEQEIEAIMRKYLGRSAWDVAEELGESKPDVPRATSHVKRLRARAGRRLGSVDRKMLAAGPESE